MQRADGSVKRGCYTRCMPLDPEFVADCPYGPGGLLIDEILEINKEENLVVARMPTHEELPLTREQRAHPLFHPRHVSGGLMVHMTGMVGFAHAYYILGLRHRDGWIGYGGRINHARFKSLAPPGEPLILRCRTTQTRRRGDTVFARYDLKFTQNERVVYEGDQVAMWMLIKEGSTLPTEMD